MDKELERRADGYMWPKHTKPDKGRYMNRAVDMELALSLCKQKKCVVQAGGHVGMWPLWLSKHFEVVHTFEPEPRNYRALELNTFGKGNIVSYRSALNDFSGTVQLNLSTNAGGHSIASVDGKDLPGMTHCLMIDDLVLDACDFIMLDIEGHELPAIRGAFNTIMQFKPIIQYEERGHGIKKGRGDTALQLEQVMRDLGYDFMRQVRNDFVWAPK